MREPCSLVVAVRGILVLLRDSEEQRSLLISMASAVLLAVIVYVTYGHLKRVRAKVKLRRESPQIFALFQQLDADRKKGKL